MHRGLSVKRWDGSARIMSGWDSLRKVSRQQSMLVSMSIQKQDNHTDMIRTRNYGTRTATVLYTCTKKAGRKGVLLSRSPSHVSSPPSARL